MPDDPAATQPQPPGGSLPYLVQPTPFAWEFQPVMVGDRRSYLLRLSTVTGTTAVFLDEEHATRLRDAITQAVSGLVLPGAASPLGPPPRPNGSSPHRGGG